MSAAYDLISEAARLVSLRSYGVLDSSPDQTFDVITRIACRTFKMPAAMISFIDEDRQWLRSALGMFSSGQETTRDHAFCSKAILAPRSALVFEDATKDPRFADNPLVTQNNGIRFYAGVPLLDEAGLALGTLCVIEVVPRRLSNEELETLRDLAECASAALNLHRSLANLRAQEAHRRASVEQNPQIPWTASPDGHFLEVSPSLIDRLAAGPEPMRRADWTRLIHPDDLPEATRRRRARIRCRPAVRHRAPHALGRRRVAMVPSYAAPKRGSDGKINLWYGSSEDIAERKASEAQVLRIAYYDNLTGLPNRARFSQVLDAEIARAENAGSSFALHCLDLDHFKSVNDRLGNPGGDAVLQQIAARLTASLQGSDIWRVSVATNFSSSKRSASTQGCRAACRTDQCRSQRNAGDRRPPGRRDRQHRCGHLPARRAGS